jgi:hypothetical protein
MQGNYNELYLLLTPEENHEIEASIPKIIGERYDDAGNSNAREL